MDDRRSPNQPVREALLKLMSDLAHRNIRACVLRNYESLMSDGPHYEERDLDLLVRARDVGKTTTTLREAGFVQLGRSLTRYHIDFVGFIDGHLVAVDLHAGFISWNGIPYLNAEKVLDTRVQQQCVPFPTPDFEVAILTLHCLLDKRAFDKRYRTRLEYLLPLAGPSAVKEILKDVIGTTLAASLVDHLTASRYTRAAVLRSHTLLKIGLLNPRNWVSVIRSSVGWRLRQFAPKRGMVVAVVGPHGVGKSTTSQELIRRFREEGWRVAHFYLGRWRDHVLPISDIARSHGVTARVDAATQTPVSADTLQIEGRRFYRGLRDLVYLSDLGLRYLLRLFPATLSTDLVITDRYAYDLLFDQSITPIGKFAITRLYPKPDLCFFLYQDVSTLKARRQEHTIAEIERQLQVFRDSADTLNLLPVHAENPMETANAIEGRIRIEHSAHT